jgi:hypothetical protein
LAEVFASSASANMEAAIDPRRADASSVNDERVGSGPRGLLSHDVIDALDTSAGCSQQAQPQAHAGTSR